MTAEFTEATYSYWRIYFHETVTLTYFQIGSIYLGTYLQLPGMKIDQTLPVITTSTASESDSGQSYGDLGYDYRNPVINYPYITQTQRAAMLTMWAEVKNVKPIVAVIWANSQATEAPLYCRIDQQELSFKRTENTLYPWSVMIKYKEVF
jgi:hypothetical protein